MEAIDYAVFIPKKKELKKIKLVPWKKLVISFRKVHKITEMDIGQCFGMLRYAGIKHTDCSTKVLLGGSGFTERTPL